MSMHLSRFRFCLIAGLMLLGASQAAAQVRIPTENTIEDLQFFAPVESNAMSDRPYLKEGLFFGWDYLTWSMQRPRATILGSPGSTRTFFDTVTTLTRTEGNSLNTGLFSDLIFDGARTEIGYMCDGCGWVVGLTGLHERSDDITETLAPIVFRDPFALTASSYSPVANTLTAGQFEPAVFDRDINGNGVFGRFGRDTGNVVDPDGAGPLPQLFIPAGTTIFVTVGGTTLTFIGQLNGIPDTSPLGTGDSTAVPPIDTGDLITPPLDYPDIKATNYTDFWCTEAMFTRRLHRISFGGHWELMGGVRYTSFEEQFYVQARGIQAILNESAWNNEAWNRIVGPQFAVRWFKDCCRWRFAAEGRFAPSVNFQSVHLTSTLGGATPGFGLTFQNSGIDTMTAYEFSPVGEVRLNWSYQLTRAISVRAGYSALYVGGLARPSNMIDYVIPNLKLIKQDYLDDAFMQGINVGFEVNR